MFTTWVTLGEDGDRFDPGFYRPEYVVNSNSTFASLPELKNRHSSVCKG
jgi:hypothetical protein